MCTLTIDCRCDTCSDGITRYQWPRIIAVQAPPSSAAELRKLATVSACDRQRPSGGDAERLQHERDEAGRRHATADDRRADRRERAADRSPSRGRSRLRRRSSAHERDARRTRRPAPSGGRNANAIAIRIAARPALKRKNFTPASRETNDEREDDADAEMGEEEEEDQSDRAWAGWRRQGWRGRRRLARLLPACQPCLPCPSISRAAC